MGVSRWRGRRGKRGARRWLISGNWKSSEETWLRTGKKATPFLGGRTIETILPVGTWNIENEFVSLSKEGWQALLKVPFGFLFLSLF